MEYIKEGKKPPKNKEELSSPKELVKRLKPLIGKSINMTGKPRTDGSTFRKMITCQLLSEHMPEAAEDFEIIPPRKKGVPLFLREYIDTYVVTTGEAYNLQVWNRNPNSQSAQVDLKNGEILSARDVRFILGKIEDNKIQSIVILTPDYIEEKFGKFGKPTIKQQLIISEKRRKEIIDFGSYIIDDTSLPEKIIDRKHEIILSGRSIKEEPEKVLPISAIAKTISPKLIGERLDMTLSTKQKGQQLERMIAYYLGYGGVKESLEGGYPDIRNQMMEIKVQDSPTIDLGKYSPQFEEQINSEFTTRTVRYLIALTNKENGSIEGIILCPGEELGKNFTYVSEKSFKCQRSIPMIFFEKFRNQVVYNPSWP